MPKFTPQQLDELYQQALAEFAASPEKWRNFLDTAARLYKYDFKSQVLIWSQRPDATACADLPLWNERLHRRVNRGSNGIGIVDNSSGQPRIKYLFNISDTSPRDQSVAPPYIWQMIWFWTVSLPHWARICRPILISLLTCICPPSVLQIRKPVSTLTTPI